MPAQPYLRSLSVQHFRGINSLKIEPLRRITLLGGLNGTGKSTLLEAVFQFFDMNNPTVLLRASQFRQTPMTLSDIHRVNEGASPSGPGMHVFVTRDGVYQLAWQWGQQDMGSLPTQQVIAAPKQQAQANSTQEGYSLDVTHNGKTVLSRLFCIGDTADAMLMKQTFAQQFSLPSASFLSRLTINNPIDLANRYSQVVQSGLKKRLLEIINSVSTIFEDIDLLHIANQPVVHLTLSGVLIPLPFAGDGITTVAAIALAIMTSRGGVVMVDEFDASVHYTKQMDAWALFHRMCIEYDTQLLVVTHSRECVEALFDAIAPSHKDDVVYYRLDKVDKRNIATPYSWEEIREASREGWEFR